MKESKPSPVFFMLLLTGIVLLIILIMQPLQIIQFHKYISVLLPKGIIALKERNLLFLLQGLMLLVVIPVYFLIFYFSWKYRAGNKNATYDPDLVDHKIAEFFWWGIPFVITAAICIITWVKTYELDPFKPLESDVKPLKVQVVALQWKWLFIYPEEKIASLNFLQIPVNRPIVFETPADAPMNSFWIPHLGGQIYAMPKMKTTLNLIANEAGDYRGSSANISGKGFADMHFITRASSVEEFDKWVSGAQQSSQLIGFSEYEKIAAPSSNDPPTLYQLQDINLFDRVIMKFMHPKEIDVR